MRRRDLYVLVAVVALTVFSVYSLVVGSMYNMPLSLVAAAMERLSQSALSAPTTTPAPAPKSGHEDMASSPEAAKAETKSLNHAAETAGAAAAKSGTLKSGKSKKAVMEEVF